MRKTGILLPVFSLPSPYGIGCFSHEAETFLDCLAASGCSYWQVLPMNPTGEGNSPYQPLSCFAGNPLLIDPGSLRDAGLLTPADMERFESVLRSEVAGDKTGCEKTDYSKLIPAKMALLRAAFDNDMPRASQDHFTDEWLTDYALFAALTEHFGTSNWITWPEDIRMRTPKAVAEYTRLLEHDIRFHIWLEQIFRQQWNKIRQHAHKNGIEIIGDIPIYAAYESADCWTHPEIFQLNRNRQPEFVSGAPPDQFAPEGQKWNTPLYDWTFLKEHNYKWWIDRIDRTFDLYDVVRIDHTRGFESYYSIPADDPNAVNGHWEPGPGLDFFRAVEHASGKRQFIAEDLGYLTPEVYEMIHKADLPGMKILQFAFDSDDNNPHLTGNYPKHCVVYTGTHDNDTVLGWYRPLYDGKKKYLLDYGKRFLPWEKINRETELSSKLPADFVHMIEATRNLGNDEIMQEADAVDLMIALALASPAETCVIPMQDWLCLDSTARINTPGTVGNNWEWRMDPNDFSDELIKRIRAVINFFR